VRLVGGSRTKEGRLEVYYNNRWGTVCDDGFTDAVARVACYALGFGSVYYLRNDKHIKSFIEQVT